MCVLVSACSTSEDVAGLLIDTICMWFDVSRSIFMPWARVSQQGGWWILIHIQVRKLQYNEKVFSVTFSTTPGLCLICFPFYAFWNKICMEIDRLSYNIVLLRTYI